MRHRAAGRRSVHGAVWMGGGNGSADAPMQSVYDCDAGCCTHMAETCIQGQSLPARDSGDAFRPLRCRSVYLQRHLFFPAGQCSRGSDFSI